MVIFFHLDMLAMSGGFVGVDIFFVISGYLITSIIIKDLDTKSFSIARFYERRIRRILPALGVVMLFCIAVSYFLLFPDEFAYFGYSVFSMAVFGTNFLFWKESGYFEPEADMVPLLHTWSLSVEEQFYVLFPLLLILIFKYAKRWRAHLVSALLLLSFAACLWGGAHEKEAAIFYLLPARAWELLAGSVLALSFLPQLKARWLCNALGALGLGFVIYAGFGLNDEIVFPGWGALWPVLGSALLIYSAMNAQTIVARALSLKPVVFIGKISYSLYLWHWPLIVFYKYASPEPLTPAWKAALLGLSFVLAALSWRFVENPVRFGLKVSRKKLFAWAALGSLAFILIGLGIHFGKGLSWRFPEDVQTLSVAKIGAPELKKAQDLHFPGDSFRFGPQGKEPSFIVWGDSHAWAAASALSALADETARAGYLLQLGGCMPSLHKVERFKAECETQNQKAVEFIRDHPQIKRIILIGYWEAYQRELLKTTIEGKPEDADPFIYAMESVLQTLKELDKDVFIVMDAPVVGVKQLPLYLARAKYYGREVNIDMSLKRHLRKMEKLYAIFDELRAEYGFIQIFPHETLCQDGECPVMHDNHSLYYDNDHLSSYGAVYLKEAFRPLFE
ncbi:MAG: acyltransferase [Alphaproteobacteria bacterium]|nr:acyltransferase [Alphaproteobacteria bacterium]